MVWPVNGESARDLVRNGRCYTMVAMPRIGAAASVGRVLLRFRVLLVFEQAHPLERP